MQATMERAGIVVTPAGIDDSPRDEDRRHRRGGPSLPGRRPGVQRIDVLAGRLIDELAAAEHQAEKGEVVLDRRRWNRWASASRSASCASRKTTGGSSASSGASPSRSTAPPPRHERGRASAKQSSRTGCCPTSSSVCARGTASFSPSCGRRTRSSCASAASITIPTTTRDRKLDGFVRQVQRVLASYGGNLLQLTLGDKGAYLYAVFGSPRAHEDDARRAAAPRSSSPRCSPRRRPATSRSASRTGGCAAAPTGTSGGGRSPASATPSTSRRG